MADGYTKLFASITDSTIWEAPDTTRLVWITMLAMADQDGYVGASVPGLAARARVSLEDCVTALDTFRAPDEWSRSKDYDGRRIIDADGGWLLLNHAKYRAIRDAEARREQARLAMAKLRAERKEAAPVTDVSNVSHGWPPLAHTEADTDTEAGKAKDTSRKRSEQSAKKLLEVEGLPENLISDFLKVRNKHRAVFTVTALEGFKREAAQAGLTLEEAVRLATESNWRGFKAEWVNKPNGASNGSRPRESLAAKSQRINADLDRREREGRAAG